MNPSKVSIGGGNFPSSHGDARDDLGYGRLNPSGHVPKQLGRSVYPYIEEDEDLDDVETFITIHSLLQDLIRPLMVLRT